MNMNIYNTPYVLKESCNGTSRISILDELMSKREIFFIGEVNTDSVSNVILQLKCLEAQDPHAEITLYIDSTGGIVLDGLALYDVMQNLSCPIKTVCLGTAASCAAFLFASGDTREILPHSEIMIHDPLVAGNGLTGTANSINEKIDTLMRYRKTLASILAKHTGKTIEEIYEKTARNTVFCAQEAVEFGLADRVIENTSSDRVSCKRAAAQRDIPENNISENNNLENNNTT